jgi:superfamily II DNA or RNA helicase
MKIKNLDTIYCKTNQPALLRVKELSFEKSYWRKGAGFFGKSIQQYDSYLVERNGTFLAGLLPRIIQYCYDKNIDVEVDDLEIDITPTGTTSAIKLDVDQQRLVQTALSKTRGVIKSPTGSGKTVMMAAMMSAFPKAKILFLCHTISLIKQTKVELDSFGVGPSSILSGSTKDTSGRIIIATIQSFSKPNILLAMQNQIDAVFVDECFAKGTQIETPNGKIEIEKINIGDKIFNKDGITEVSRVFKTKIKLHNVVLITKSDNSKIFCSANHLFLTKENKWVKAKNILNKNLFAFPYFLDIMQNTTSKMEKDNERTSTKNNNQLSYLQKRIREKNKITAKILFKNMLIQRPRKKNFIFKNNGKNKQKICIRKNEEKQSIKKSIDCRKKQNDKKNKWNWMLLEVSKNRWKWQSNANSATITGSSSWLENRICNFNSKKYFEKTKRTIKIKWNKSTNLLQSRHSKRRIKNSNRSRWMESQYSWKKRKRSKQRELPIKTRVESVEIYKQGSNDESFSSIIGDKERNQGFVEFYDLEVNGHPSYFASNVLVHNCHHISSLKPKAGYYKVLTSLIAPIKYGFTATTQKESEAAFALEALIGPVIGETTMQQSISSERLAIPTLKLIAVEPLDLREIHGYQNIYQKAIVEYRKRNRLIIETAKELNDQGQSVLIYINKLEHGERLLDIAERMNFNLLFIRGETEDQERENARTALNDKKIMTVVATVVWKEGVNIRTLDCIIMAGGGKKELSLIQSVGRGLRRTEEKTTALFIDFLDIGRYLSEHCVSRLTTYSKFGWLK